MQQLTREIFFHATIPPIHKSLHGFCMWNIYHVPWGYLVEYLGCLQNVCSFWLFDMDAQTLVKMNIRHLEQWSTERGDILAVFLFMQGLKFPNAHSFIFLFAFFGSLTRCSGSLNGSSDAISFLIVRKLQPAHPSQTIQNAFTSIVWINWGADEINPTWVHKRAGQWNLIYSSHFSNIYLWTSHITFTRINHVGKEIHYYQHQLCSTSHFLHPSTIWNFLLEGWIYFINISISYLSRINFRISIM